MKVFDLPSRVGNTGETVLGPQETGALTTYLIFGELSPWETGRRLLPGSGREEILFVVNGEVRLEDDRTEAVVCPSGSAVLLSEGSDTWLSNTTSERAHYILAGGFTEPAKILRQMEQARNRMAR